MFRKRQIIRAKRLSTSRAIGLIIGVMALALVLKVVDDRRRGQAAFETITQREALALSEHLSGRAERVRQLLGLSWQAGWGPRQTARFDGEVEKVVSLASALSAPDQSRIMVAGETASRLIAEGASYGLTQTGDLIIPHNPETGSPRFAIVKVEAWLPEAEGARTFTLEQASPTSISRDGLTLTKACVAMQSGGLSACVTNRRSLFSWQDGLSLLAFALLLAGPAFALLGLYKLVEQREAASEAFEGEATRAGRLLASVLKEARAGFWSWDAKTDTVYLSQEAATLLGVMEAGHYHFSDLIDSVHPDHHGAVQQALDTLPDKGLVAQSFAVADGSRWLDLRASPDPEVPAVNGVMLDVTELRTAVARTRRAEGRLKSALEGFSGPFALWNAQHRLVYWNLAFARVFGLQDTLRQGMSHETVALAQAASILERRLLQTENGAEVVRVTNGAWYKIVERQTNGGGMITVGLDVSADVRNEVELTIQSKRLKKLIIDLERSEGHKAELASKLNEEKVRAEESANAKSAFLANMSHELRTPLNAINGFSDVMVQELYGPLGDDRYKDYARDILDSGRHLLDMINDILDMAKIEAGKMTVDLRNIDLLEPVDAAVRMIRRKAEEKGVALNLVANEGLPLVDADHRAIKQMVLNLVSNAIKFTDGGGRVRVTLDRKDDMVRVAVTDTGVGIPAEALPRLAQPFEQVSDTRDRNYDGTGLGLALTKSFAEMHGGWLDIRSEEGQGTQVAFFIPVAAEPGQQRPSAA
ncbi:MAG: PAS domain-containing sensor histidine kinase [Pseudomonadota bacterium]